MGAGAKVSVDGKMDKHIFRVLPNSTLSTLLTAPEGRYIPAQGEALGKERLFVQALKGRDIMPYHVDVTPFQGCISGAHLTQGAALGWYVTPLRG